MDDTTLVGAETPGKVAEQAGETYRFLLVDDSRSFTLRLTRMIKMMFAGCSKQIVIFSESEALQAYFRIRDESFSLIIVDHLLAGSTMTGAELIAHIGRTAVGTHAPLLFISGYHLPASVTEDPNSRPLKSAMKRHLDMSTLQGLINELLLPGTAVSIPLMPGEPSKGVQGPRTAVVTTAYKKDGQLYNECLNEVEVTNARHLAEKKRDRILAVKTHRENINRHYADSRANSRSMRSFLSRKRRSLVAADLEQDVPASLRIPEPSMLKSELQAAEHLCHAVSLLNLSQLKRHLPTFKLAVQSTSCPIVGSFLEILNTANFHGLAPLHIAAGRGDMGTVDYLLSQGADVNCGPNNYTPYAHALNSCSKGLGATVESISHLYQHGGRLSRMSKVEQYRLQMQQEYEKSQARRLAKQTAGRQAQRRRRNRRRSSQG